MSVENCHFKAKKSPSFHSKNVFIFDFLLFLFFSLVCECIMEWLRWASSSVLYVKTCCCINVAILKERKKRKQKTNQKKWKRYKEIDDGNESNFHPSLMDWRSFLFHLNYVLAREEATWRQFLPGACFFLLFLLLAVSHQRRRLNIREGGQNGTANS